MDRRRFIKTLGFAGATAASGAGGAAIAGTESNKIGKEEFLGILMDTTLCVGCGKCERACAKANDLPSPEAREGAELDVLRSTSETCFTVVNRHKSDAGDVFIKRQCMHCSQPACAAACLTKAMLKTKEGPVIWLKEKCMGCRFCMVSCPFDAPKFEYNSAMPRIRKCTLCWTRLREGQQPACVSVCPSGALTFGKRKELVRTANARIYSGSKRDYVPHIYGEHEVGGTGAMYLAAVPFEKLGLNMTLGTKPYPEYTKGFLYSVPFVFLLWPALLLGLQKAFKARDEHAANPIEDKGATT